jgi:hypothetical protein
MDYNLIPMQTKPAIFQAMKLALSGMQELDQCL